MQAFEEKLAHLQRMVDELSDVVARQDRQLDQMQDQVDRLTRREAAREDAATGGAHFGGERPPHY